MRFVTHLVTTAIDVLFRAILTAIVTAAIAAGSFYVVATQIVHQWPPTLLSEIAGSVIVVLAAYAGATTVILRGITKSVVGTEKAVETEVKKVA